MAENKKDQGFTPEQLEELRVDAALGGDIPFVGLAGTIGKKVVPEIIEAATPKIKSAADAVADYLKNAHVTKVMEEAVPNEVEKTLLMKLKEKLPDSIADAIPVSWKDALQVMTAGRAVSSDRKAYLAELYNSDRIEDGVRVVKTQLLGQAAPYVATLGGTAIVGATMVSNHNQEQKDAAYSEKLAKMSPNERLATVFQDSVGNQAKEKVAAENPEYQKLVPAFKAYHDKVEHILKENPPIRTPYNDEVSGQTSDKASREIYQLKREMVESIKNDSMHLSDNANGQHPKTLAEAVAMIEKAPISQQTKEAIYTALSEKVNDAGHTLNESRDYAARPEEAQSLG